MAKQAASKVSQRRSGFVWTHHPDFHPMAERVSSRAMKPAAKVYIPGLTGTIRADSPSNFDIPDGTGKLAGLEDIRVTVAELRGGNSLRKDIDSNFRAPSPQDAGSRRGIVTRTGSSPRAVFLAVLTSLCLAFLVAMPRTAHAQLLCRIQPAGLFLQRWNDLDGQFGPLGCPTGPQVAVAGTNG